MMHTPLKGEQHERGKARSPAKRIPVKTAWDDLLERLKPGQHLACQAGHEKTVGDALRRWLRRKGKSSSLRVVTVAASNPNDPAWVWLVEIKK